MALATEIWIWVPVYKLDTASLCCTSSTGSGEGTYFGTLFITRNKTGMSTITPPFWFGLWTLSSCYLSVAKHYWVPQIFRRGQDCLICWWCASILGSYFILLVAVLSIISTYGSFSGFTINWDKSVILPIDPLVNNMPSLAFQIAVVSTFKYLGIQVTSQMAEHVERNLDPLLKHL